MDPTPDRTGATGFNASSYLDYCRFSEGANRADDFTHKFKTDGTLGRAGCAGGKSPVLWGRRPIEGLPVAAVEAMASYLPAVVTRVSGLEEV